MTTIFPMTTTSSTSTPATNLFTMARKSIHQSIDETRLSVEILGDDDTSLGDAVAITSALWRKQLLRCAIWIVNALIATIAGAIWLHERIRRHTWTRQARALAAAKAIQLATTIRQQWPTWRQQAEQHARQAQQRLRQALLDAGLIDATTQN